MTLIFTEEAARAEMWTSFVSLMRSHLAAVAITGRLEGFRIEVLTPKAMLITDGIQSLSLCVWDSGENLWIYYDEEQSKLSHNHWALNTDATVLMYEGEEPVEMELAVEAFAAMLVRSRN